MKKGHDRIRDFLREEPDNRPRVGKYRLVREIGRGGMGIVYEAEDPELHRRVALKILREAEADPHVIRRLHREAAIAAQLQHPNIVGIYEVGEVTTETGLPQHFIAMAFVDGKTLAELLEEGRTPLPDLVRILEEVTRAVAFAHSRGVIHRDLKPDNILIDSNGRVVLTDFGLAHAESFLSRLTRSNAVMGTPHYMSPEQVEGRTRDISEASDIYALGVILYEILAGHPPFRADAPVRVYQKILAEDAERITRPVNPDLEMICRKAMEKEPKRRYDRALDFADDLSRFRRGEPIRARPPSLFYRFRKTLARRRSSVIAAATIVSVLSATAVYLHTRQERDRTERDAEARRQNEERGRERRIREEEERQRLVKDERARRLREEMDPVEIRIRDTRRLFYVPDVDMRSEIEKLEAALTRLERLTIEEAYASVPELWGLLGIGRYFTGEADLAQQALEKAEKLGSTDGWVFYYLGRIHLENGLSYRLTESYDIQRVRDFTEVGKKYIKRSTATEPIDLQIAEGYLALAEDEGAEISAKLRKICEEGLQRFGTMPGTEEFRLLLAWGYEGKLEDQLAEYTKAIERRPHFPWALFLRATVRYRRNDLPGTQKDYDAALRLYPKWWLPYLNRGAVRAQLKDLDGAFADFSAVTRLNPSYYAGWFNRGRVYFFRKEYDSALADFDQAIKLRPKYAMAHMNKGNVLYDLKRYDDAFEAFQHAIDLDGTSPLARANRGLIYARWGKWKEAAADFETALRLAPEDWEHRTFVENNYRASLQRARAQDP